MPVLADADNGRANRQLAEGAGELGRHSPIIASVRRFRRALREV